MRNNDKSSYRQLSITKAWYRYEMGKRPKIRCPALVILFASRLFQKHESAILSHPKIQGRNSSKNDHSFVLIIIYLLKEIVAEKNN